MKKDTQWCAYDRVKKGYVKTCDDHKGYHLTKSIMDALTWSERVGFTGFAEQYQRKPEEWEWRPRPNRQRYRVEYDEKHPLHISQNVVASPEKGPYVDDNGWLQVGAVGTNTHNIENLVIEPIGTPYYDKMFGGECD